MIREARSTNHCHAPFLRYHELNSLLLGSTMSISTASIRSATTIMSVRYTNYCAHLHRRTTAPFQTPLTMTTGQNGRRHVSGICVCRPPCHEALRMGQRLKRRAQSCRKTRSTVHYLGDAIYELEDVQACLGLSAVSECLSRYLVCLSFLHFSL